MPSPQIVVDILTEALFLEHYQTVTVPLGAYERLPWVYNNGNDRPMDINFEHCALPNQRDQKLVES